MECYVINWCIILIGKYEAFYKNHCLTILSGKDGIPNCHCSAMSNAKKIKLALFHSYHFAVQY